MNTEQRTRRQPPTLEEVAATAGVSRSTVSRVVNGSTQVSPEVLETVTAAIERLNYVPNRAARSLANRQTMAIALVVPEETTRFFGDPYFAAVVHGIAHAIESSDYVLNLQLATPASPTAKMAKYLRGGNVDGAIVVSHHSGDQFLSGIGDSLPLVFGGRPLRIDDERTYFVDVDNAAAAELGTQYLIDTGRTAIATIAGPPDMPAGVDRADGWRRAVQAAGQRDDLIAYGDFTMVSGAIAMRELLDSGKHFDGVFVASDLMATGAITVLRERGRRVPEDVAVVGFDDSPAAMSGDIQLTTVHQPSQEMGERMATTLLALLRGESPEHQQLLPTHIVVRASA